MSTTQKTVQLRDKKENWHAKAVIIGHLEASWKQMSWKKTYPEFKDLILYRTNAQTVGARVWYILETKDFND